jgi:hypothetical protein
MITQEYLKECVSYNPNTGVFSWRAPRPKEHFCSKSSYKKWHTQYAGKPCLSLDAKGYPCVKLKGKRRLLHQLAFLYVTGSYPAGEVDHINHISDDNRFCNLRIVTRLENSRNMPLFSSNRSGVPGVVWHKGCSKWQAQIRDNGTCVYLGIFSRLCDAKEARDSALIKYGYHPNHGKPKHDLAAMEDQE